MSPNNELTGGTTIVVGASRGLGRGIATAIAQAGDAVVAGARSATALAELAGDAGNIQPLWAGNSLVSSSLARWDSVPGMPETLSYFGPIECERMLASTAIATQPMITQRRWVMHQRATTRIVPCCVG
jgi:NAD(P)-dependent dehydrogenase (short-subunit alcohol dehydrogenase family)